MSKTILVRNTKKRVFNGVRPFQIVSIPEDNWYLYKGMGFEKYVAKKSQIENDDSGRSPEILERVEFLDSHGVTVSSNRKDKTIVKKSDKLGFDKKQDNEVSETDLKNLDPEDINDGEDEVIEE